MAEKMDRGDTCTDACKAHLGGSAKFNVRQTRRGWLQEFIGCDAKSEFSYFNADGTKVATSLEESGWFCRVCFTAIHPFTMQIKEVGTEAELLTVERPCACGLGPCKCCCFQSATFSSGGVPLGSIEEECYYCVSSFKISDGNGTPIYRMHPPTCLGGTCPAICTEGNPCSKKGCCKVPFWVFEAGQKQTNGTNVPYLSKIVKLPKSLATELFTDANAFDVIFPDGATVNQKAILVGSSIFLNAVFFESQDNSA